MNKIFEFDWLINYNSFNVILNDKNPGGVKSLKLGKGII